MEYPRHLSASGRFVVYNYKIGGVHDKIDGDTHISAILKKLGGRNE